MSRNNGVILEAREIRKFYNKEKALDIQSYRIYEGAFNFLLGPNGSGKTTLLKILSLTDQDYSGQLHYRGQMVGELEAEQLKLRRRFSVVWQFPYLYSGSVMMNIGLPLQLRKRSADEIEERVHHLAVKLGIAHLLSKNVNSLSGGEKQKVSIARALITEPELLFVDEPTTYLDWESTQFLNELFRELVDKGMTMLLITHDLYQIEKLADYITILRDGKMSTSGTKDEVRLAMKG